MKKSNAKKATALLLTSVLVATTLLSGCGKKKVDYMEEGEGGKADSGDLATKLGIPESYDGEVAVGKSGLTSIKISDTDIVVPDKDSMSVVYYERNDMDNAYKQKIAEALFDKSQGIYLYDWDKPYKGDIEAMIEQYQSLVDEATKSGDTDSVEWYTEYIETLKQQLSEASDKREGAGDYSGDEFIGNVGKNQFMLSVMNTSEGLGSCFSFSLYPSDSYLQYRPYEGAAMAYCYDGAYTDDEEMEDSSNKCSLSSDEAVEYASSFLSKCGINDVINTSVTDLTWEYDNSVYDIIAMENDGYVVNFSRSVDGVVPYTGYTYMLEYMWDSDLFYDTAYETYKLNVDDNGIIEAECYDFLKPTGEKDSNVELLTWEKILECLETAVSDFYSENATNYDKITFNDVRLSYYRISDGENRYKYIPVWIFAQCEEYEGELDTDYPIQLIMLDAVTGELINLKDVLVAESYDMEDDSDYDIDYDDDTIIMDDSEEGQDDGDIIIDDGSDAEDIDTDNIDAEETNSEL
ncbi:MAG: hypothetical protein ACI4EF_00870 [Coprococcus sp.]